ncbi:hypothetical protein ACIO13_00870 [Streptomyces sp. NPDC087425]|uniref:hypothetical protein n=1 Tax=Streptomyces sp. NPDC087425 TaxID=3365787 RepID=UPI00382A375D
MRLCPSLALCLAAAAPSIGLVGTAPPAHAAPAASCAADDPHFPLTTRIENGPGTYQAGGGYGTWSLKLTNTTDRSCGNVHPVVVLVDERRTLRPEQPLLEFFDEDRRPHPVHFEVTDEDELVGAFDDGFPGFTVGPKKTVSVAVRLALTSDAEPNDITAKAALVQRQGGNGEWVGQSNDYAFRVEDSAGADTGGGTGGDTGGDTAVPPPASATPSRSAPASASSPAPATSPAVPPGREQRLPFADELAATGVAGLGGILVAAVLLVLTGGALLLARRRK